MIYYQNQDYNIDTVLCIIYNMCDIFVTTPLWSYKTVLLQKDLPYSTVYSHTTHPHWCFYSLNSVFQRLEV